jgi:hypothetical protein
MWHMAAATAEAEMAVVAWRSGENIQSGWRRMAAGALEAAKAAARSMAIKPEKRGGAGETSAELEEAAAARKRLKEA